MNARTGRDRYQPIAQLALDGFVQGIPPARVALAHRARVSGKVAVENEASERFLQHRVAAVILALLRRGQRADQPWRRDGEAYAQRGKHAFRKRTDVDDVAIAI